MEAIALKMKRRIFNPITLEEPRINKAKLIKFLARLDLQKDLLEVEKGRIKMTDIKAAGKRLGKKAQSAFETKG